MRCKITVSRFCGVLARKFAIEEYSAVRFGPIGNLSWSPTTFEIVPQSLCHPAMPVLHCRQAKTAPSFTTKLRPQAPERHPRRPSDPGLKEIIRVSSA